MTYQLYIGDNLCACTGNHDWLIKDAIPFHRRWNRGAVLILSFPEGGVL